MIVVGHARVERRNEEHPGRQAIGERFQDQRSRSADGRVRGVCQSQGRRQVDRALVERQGNGERRWYSRAIVPSDEWCTRRDGGLRSVCWRRSVPSLLAGGACAGWNILRVGRRRFVLPRWCGEQTGRA